MATVNSLATNMLTKMREVPNITIVECTDFVNTAVVLHGGDINAYTPLDEQLVLLLAQSEGARNVALNVSHYFSYQDGDNQVDKTKIAAQYLQLAADFLSAYNAKVKPNVHSSYTITTRADR